MAKADMTQHRRELTSAELGALAHLYRGEIYRSTIWRTRLDTTTNWAVVTLGVALSITFASPRRLSTIWSGRGGRGPLDLIHSVNEQAFSALGC